MHSYCQQLPSIAQSLLAWLYTFHCQCQQLCLLLPTPTHAFTVEQRVLVSC